MKTSRCQKLLAIGCGLALMLTCGSALAQQPEATASLVDTQGRNVGKVSLTDGPNGVLLKADLNDLPPGTHAFHIHAVGACTPDFKAAGGHFNPTGKKHGFMDASGMHLGDMPNIHVPSSGKLTVEYFLPGVHINKGENKLMDQDGSAVMIHAGSDDYKTDPAGAAGDRMACGVISAK